MRKKIRFILLYFLVVPIILMITALILFTTFQYTVIADLRESFIEVDTHDELAYGKVLFDTRGCSGCHSIVPGQKNLGPNLFGLSTRGPREYIRQSIVSPNAAISQGFSADIMPNFGEILDEKQVNALVGYVSSIK